MIRSIVKVDNFVRVILASNDWCLARGSLTLLLLHLQRRFLQYGHDEFASSNLVESKGWEHCFKPGFQTYLDYIWKNVSIYALLVQFSMHPHHDDRSWLTFWNGKETLMINISFKQQHQALDEHLVIEWIQHVNWYPNNPVFQELTLCLPSFVCSTSIHWVVIIKLLDK